MEHGSGLLRDALPGLLDRGRVAEESGRHLEALFGGVSQIGDLTLFGIHSAKYGELLLATFSICPSTSFVDMRPRNRHEHVR